MPEEFKYEKREYVPFDRRLKDLDKRMGSRIKEMRKIIHKLERMPVSSQEHKERRIELLDAWKKVLHMLEVENEANRKWFRALCKNKPLLKLITLQEKVDKAELELMLLEANPELAEE